MVPGRYVLQRCLCSTEARNAEVVGSGRTGIGPGATVKRGRKLDGSVESQKRMWTRILSNGGPMRPEPCVCDGDLCWTG